MENTKSFTIRDIVRIFFNHKVFFIVLPLVLVISAYIGGQLRTPVYTASVRMFIKGEKRTTADFYSGIQMANPVSNHSALLKSNRVLNRVVEALKLYKRPVDYERKYTTPLNKAFIDYRNRSRKNNNQDNEADDRVKKAAALGNLFSRVGVTPIPESALFYIHVSDYDPYHAVRMANSVSRSYVIFDLEQQIEELKLKYGDKHSIIMQLKIYIEEFKQTLNGELIPDLEAIGPATVKIVAQAENASINVGVSSTILMLFAIVTGFFMAGTIASVIEYTDNTFKTPQKVIDHLRIPVLATIPKKKSSKIQLINESKPEISSYVESFQNLSRHLPLLMRDKKVKSLLITGVEDSQGTAVVNANLGICLARNSGRKILLVDADLRTSSLSKSLNAMNDIGLANILEGNASMINVVQSLGTSLDLLPSGTTEVNPVMLLESSEMSEVIKQAKEVYELILVNCPDVKNHTDPAILSSVVDGTVLVINAGSVKRQVYEIAIMHLKQEKDNMIGAILNNYQHVIPEIIYKLT